MSQITAPWQLFALFGTFIGVGLATHDVVTLGTIARWFHRRRGIMSGVVKVGTAAGQIALPPFAALLIAGFGWRSALVVLGILAAALLLLAATTMRMPPATDHSNTTLKTGETFAHARRTRIFWTLCAIQFLFFPALMSIPLHLAVHGTDLGLSVTTAATLLSVIGAASVAGRLGMGALHDRIGGKNAYTACLAILAASLAGFAVITTPLPLFAVVAIYGFAHGALFVVVSPTAAEYFGMRAHGAVFGTILFFGTLGGSIGPILTGLVFDHLGSYQPAFITLGLAAALALVLARTLPQPHGA
jgi:MFS family permease